MVIDLSLSLKDNKNKIFGMCDVALFGARISLNLRNILVFCDMNSICIRNHLSA